MQVLCTRKASITTGKQPQVSVCHLTAGSVLDCAQFVVRCFCQYVLANQRKHSLNNQCKEQNKSIAVVDSQEVVLFHCLEKEFFCRWVKQKPEKASALTGE